MKESSNKPLIAAMIIIAVIIVILFLGSRSRLIGPSYYSQRTSWFVTTPSPVVNYQFSNTPEVIKTYGHPITVNTDRSYYYHSSPVTTYTTTTYKYIYPNQSTQAYPDGCNAYTAYSATTGWPCR